MKLKPIGDGLYVDGIVGTTRSDTRMGFATTCPNLIMLMLMSRPAKRRALPLYTATWKELSLPETLPPLGSYPMSFTFPAKSIPHSFGRRIANINLGLTFALFSSFHIIS